MAGQGFQEAVEWALKGVRRDAYFIGASADPDFDLDGVDAWLWGDDYGAPVARYVDSVLYFMAREVSADYGFELSMHLNSEGFQDWADPERTRIEASVFAGWKFLSGRSLRSRRDEKSDASDERENFAFRFFELARELDVLSPEYFKPLFETLTDPYRFRTDCEFIAKYGSEVYAQPGHPWLAFLPPRKEVLRHLEEGFFMHPEHEKVASTALDYLDLEAYGFQGGAE